MKDEEKLKRQKEKDFKIQELQNERLKLMESMGKLTGVVSVVST
jgi:hypothetical protein